MQWPTETVLLWWHAEETTKMRRENAIESMHVNINQRFVLLWIDYFFLFKCVTFSTWTPSPVHFHLDGWKSQESCYRDEERDCCSQRGQVSSSSVSIHYWWRHATVQCIRFRCVICLQNDFRFEIEICPVLLLTTQTTVNILCHIVCSSWLYFVTWIFNICLEICTEPKNFPLNVYAY